jgi:predicted Zn finger-like uncharacterized protein
MSIATKCSHCGASYNLNEGMAGKKVRCKSCQEIFLVPAAGAAKAPAKPANGSQKIQPATRPVKAGATPPPRPSDDDPDDKPVKKPAPKKSSTGKVLLIVGGISAALLFICCGIPTGLAFFGAFSFQSKVDSDIKQAQSQFDKEFEKAIKEQQKAMENQNRNPVQKPVKVEVPQPGPDKGTKPPEVKVEVPQPGPDKGTKPPEVKVEVPNNLPNPFAQKEPANLADALMDLRGSDAGKQEAAARWLAKQPVDAAQQEEVAKALGAMLADKKHPGADRSALSALKTWATKDNVPAIAAFLDSNTPGPGFFPGSALDVAMETLGRLADERGAEAVARYVTNFFTGEAAAKSLRAMGPVAEKAVLKYYNDPDGGRERGRKLLQEYGTKDKAIASQCAADLKANKVETRRLAADALSQVKVDPELQPEVAKALEDALDGPDKDLRAKAVQALGTWATQDNVPALVKCLNGEERRSAGRALQKIGAPAEKELLMYVGDPTSNRDGVREAERVLQTMGSKGSGVVTLALTDLKSPDANRRRDAADRLMQMPAPDKGSQADVAKALVAVLDDPDEGTRDRAARALIVWATPDSVPALIKALDSTDIRVRHHSMEALGKMKEESAARPIASHLTKGDDREAAGKALKLMVGTKAEGEVIPYLPNPDHHVRLEAVRILQVIGTKKSLKPLEALVQLTARTDKEVANAAIQAGQEIGRR